VGCGFCAHLAMQNGRRQSSFCIFDSSHVLRGNSAWILTPPLPYGAVICARSAAVDLTSRRCRCLGEGGLRLLW
jgi:hypothetical protein